MSNIKISICPRIVLNNKLSESYWSIFIMSVLLNTCPLTLATQNNPVGNIPSTKKDSLNSTFKVITYNIWNGYDWGKDSFRRKHVQDWINEQKPDVVALQELCKYSSEKLAEDAKSWGHNYSVLLKTTGYSVGITSAKPIELKENLIEGMHHGALYCKSFGIDILVIHLHPGNINRRREETAILMSKLKEIQKETGKYIVLGDFNAHSPFDAQFYPLDGNLITRLKKSNQNKGLDGNLDGNNLDYSVVSSFLSLPLYDPVQNFSQEMAERGSFPGRVLGLVNNESDEKLIARLERIDYILVSPSLSQKCQKARVANGQDNWYLSDHYPVIAEFDISRN